MPSRDAGRRRAARPRAPRSRLWLWLPLLLVPVITVATVTTIARGREYADRARQAQILIAQLAEAVQEQNALEWETAAGDRVTPEIAVKRRAGFRRIDASLARLALVDADDDNVGRLVERFAVYERGTARKLRLLEAGHAGRGRARRGGDGRSGVGRAPARARQRGTRGQRGGPHRPARLDGRHLGLARARRPPDRGAAAELREDAPPGGGDERRARAARDPRAPERRRGRGADGALVHRPRRGLHGVRGCGARLARVRAGAGRRSLGLRGVRRRARGGRPPPPGARGRGLHRHLPGGRADLRDALLVHARRGRRGEDRARRIHRRDRARARRAPPGGARARRPHRQPHRAAQPPRLPRGPGRRAAPPRALGTATLARHARSRRAEAGERLHGPRGGRRPASPHGLGDAAHAARRRRRLPPRGRRVRDHRRRRRRMGRVQPRAALRAELTAGSGGTAGVTAGIAEVREPLTRDELVNRADLALIQAKRVRRGALIYTDGLVPDSTEVDQRAERHHRSMLATALARAVDAKDSYTRSHCETVSRDLRARGRRARARGRSHRGRAPRGRCSTTWGRSAWPTRSCASPARSPGRSSTS